MVTVPVKVTFNFDDEDKKNRKKKKTSSDESSTSDDDEKSDDNDSMPDLEGEEKRRKKTTAGYTDEPQYSMERQLPDEVTSKQKQSRSEKKARKALAKLGMKQVHGIKRVVIRKSKNVLFIIAQPEVYKSYSSDTYVVIGEVKVEDLSQQAQVAAAEKFKSNEGGERTREQIKEVEIEEIDETGIESADIDLVMSQTGVSRTKAVQALRNNGYDIVNAIMELTM